MADVPPQRITDLETATRQRRQLSCILDSCTIAASYEVNQAQKALLLMPRTAKGASTSSGELNAQVSLPTDDEYHAFHDQALQEHSQSRSDALKGKSISHVLWLAASLVMILVGNG